MQSTIQLENQPESPTRLPRLPGQCRAKRDGGAFLPSLFLPQLPPLHLCVIFAPSAFLLLPLLPPLHPPPLRSRVYK